MFICFFRYIFFVFIFCFSFLETIAYNLNDTILDTNYKNTYRQKKLQLWQAKKNKGVDTVFWQEVADSIAYGRILCNDITPNKALKLDSVLKAIYNPIETIGFVDSVLNAMRFVAWHGIGKYIDGPVEDGNNLFNSYSLQQQFAFFEADNDSSIISIECSEYANYFSKVLAAAHIVSYRYFIKNVHEMTLVYHADKDAYYLIDPMYLRYLGDSRGQPIDIRLAMQQLYKSKFTNSHGLKWKSVAKPYCCRHVIDNFSCYLAFTTWNFNNDVNIYRFKNQLIMEDAYHADEAIANILYFSKEKLPYKQGYPQDEVYLLLDAYSDAPIKLPSAFNDILNKK